MCNGVSKRKCKKCYNDYMRDYMKTRYETRRSQILEKLGGCCVKCGSSENLEIDHVDRNKKKFDIGKAIAGWSWVKLNAELEKCQLLCKKHHQDKTIEENSVEHGQGATGKRGCHCELCGPLKQKYTQKYRKEKNTCVCGTKIDIRSTVCRKCNTKKLNSMLR